MLQQVGGWWGRRGCGPSPEDGEGVPAGPWGCLEGGTSLIGGQRRGPSQEEDGAARREVVSLRGEASTRGFDERSVMTPGITLSLIPDTMFFKKENISRVHSSEQQERMSPSSAGVNTKY